MGLWPLAFKSYGPFLKSMGHGSYGMGQKLKKRNIGILVRDVTFDMCITQHLAVDIKMKQFYSGFTLINQTQQLFTLGEEQSVH